MPAFAACGAKVVALARSSRSAYCRVMLRHVNRSDYDYARPKTRIGQKCCPVDHLSRHRHTKYVLLGIVGGCFLFWVAACSRFEAIPEGVDDATQKTDAIVVLTGGSLRLQTGLTLLKEGRANKLSPASNAAWTCANCCALPEHR